MNKSQRLNFRLIVVTLFSVCLSQTMQAQRLTYKTNAIGNDWLGVPGPHVQNHINNMTVAPDGTCYTQSVWDEGGNSYGVYKNGKHISNAGGPAKANSQVVTDKAGKTWAIMNYFGRFLSQKTGAGGVGYLAEDYDRYVLPIPTGSNAPYIKCSDGREIRLVKDPSAIGINHKTGQLLVADQTEAQNIKIFDISAAPALVDSFGVYGGVWAGSRPGLMDNMLKFAGICGVGADSEGNIYVCNTIVNKQEGSGGGVDLRAFNPDGTLRWRALGVLFLVSAGVDPSTNGTDIVTPYYRFRLDYSKPAGTNWQVISTNINPFKYPDDPRLICSAEDGYSYKIINGKKFLLVTDMYMNGVYLFRMDGEIAVPCAVFCGRYGWNGDEHNRLNWKWHRGRPDMPRWFWCDRNGDGSADPSEFESYDIGHFVDGLEIDDDGNFYFCSSNNKIMKFPNSGFDSYGNPQYSAATVKSVLELGTAPYTMTYVPENDMLVMGIDQNNGIKRARIYKDFIKGTPVLARTINLVPAKNNNCDGHGVSQVTADAEYLYSTYACQNGPFTGKEGEVVVHKISDGSLVGYITPGPEVGSHSGWIDMWHPTKVFKRYSGERIICVEEDHVGKILVYQWCPTGDCNLECSASVDSVRINQHNLEIDGLDTLTLTAQVLPNNVCYSKLAWHSSDEQVLKVNREGEVISLKVGSAYIKAVSEQQPGISDSCLVIVKEVPLNSITLLGADTISVAITKSKALGIGYDPTHTTNRTITWISSDTLVASIDKNGVVTALKEGFSNIKAKTAKGNVTDSCIIKAIPIPLTGVNFKLRSSFVWVTDTANLEIEFHPADANNKALNWSSLNQDIAVVNSIGRVTGISIGKTNIVIRSVDGGFSDTCLINVLATNEFGGTDVGSPCAKGSFNVQDNVYKLTAGGADIWNNYDAFQFAYQNFSGDGVIIARVKSISNTSDWAKGGVMMRETLDMNSKHAMMTITPGNGTTFQRRPKTGGTSEDNTPIDKAKAPIWVKLVRKGSVLTGYKSLTGRLWTLVGEATIEMNKNIFIGLCLTSHNDCNLATATFDNLVVSTNPDTVLNIPNTPPVTAITAPLPAVTAYVSHAVTIKANATDDDVVTKVEFYDGNTMIGSDASSPYSINYTFLSEGEKTLTVKAYDNEGGITVSAQVLLNVLLNTGLNELTTDKELNLYPNPVHDVLNIGLYSASSKQASLSVIGMNGKMIYSEKISLKAGTNDLKFDTAKLKPGSYLLRINDSEKKFSVY